MRVVLSLVLAFVIATVFNRMLPYGVQGIMPWLAVFVVAFFILKKMLRTTKPPPVPADFNARYSHDNIAIDIDAGKLWLRDKSGSRVVDKSEVLRWNRIYRNGNGGSEIDNRLEVHLRDLDRPKWVVPFKRHGDTWKSGAARNAQESEEWASRLTTWMNNT